SERPSWTWATPPLVARDRVDGDGSASKAPPSPDLGAGLAYVTDGPRPHELAAERDREHRRWSPSDRVDVQRRQRTGLAVDPVRGQASGRRARRVQEHPRRIETERGGDRL